MMQFIVKSIFLCSLTYLGVKIIKLDFRIFVPLLCLTWFVFHLVEYPIDETLGVGSGVYFP